MLMGISEPREIEITVQCVRVQRRGRQWAAVFAGTTEVESGPALSADGFTVTTEWEPPYAVGRVYTLQIKEAR